MGAPDDDTVLVVDDDPDLTDLYAEQLSGDYDVRTAYDGESARSAVDETVDVVLLDRRMPDLSGDELLRKIRDGCPDVRVVMVTAVVPDFDIVDMDFDDYLVKPVTRDELRDTVERMRRRSTYQELVQEYFTLTSKYAALKTHRSQEELAESDEFDRLERRLDDVKSELDSLVAEFDSEDFRVLYRDLS